MLRWISLLAACWLGSGARLGGQGTSEMKYPGLLFQPAGRLLLTTGEWTLVTRVQAGEVQRQKDEIRAQLDEVTNALAQSREMVPQGRSGDREEEELQRMANFYRSCEQSWAKEMEWMSRELDSAEANLVSILREERRTRKARSLIPFIGKGLSYLFGTATEEETTKLHQEIRRMKVEAGRVHHVQELQATLIGRLARVERQGRKDLTMLANKTNEIILMMAKTRDHSRAVHRHLRWEVDVTRAIGAAARTATAAVVTFRQEAEALARAFTHAREGRLTAELVRPRVLARALAALQAQLPVGWVLAMQDGKGVQRRYGDLVVSTVPLNDGYEVHARVPLRQAETGLLNLYQVKALPTGLVNRTVGVITETEAEWFAVTPDQRAHVELTSKDLERCRHGEGITSCDELPRALREDREGCVYQAFRGDAEAARRACVRRVVPLEAGLRRISPGHWAYAFPAKAVFTLQCEGKVTGDAFQLQGTGLFEVPKGCAAVGDEFTIPAHFRGSRTAVKGRKIEDMAVFDTTTGLRSVLQEGPGEDGDTNEEPDAQLVRLADELPDDALINATIAQLGTTLARSHGESAADYEAQGWMATVKEHSPLTLSTICLAGLAALVARACVRKRKGSVGSECAVDTPTRERVAALCAKVEGMADVAARLAKLEQQAEGHARDIETLKKFM